MITKINILLILLLFVILSCSYAQNTYVVAVGLGKYKYPLIAPPLPCSVGDAKAVSKFFYNYKKRNRTYRNAYRKACDQYYRRKSTYNDNYAERIKRS